MALLALAYIIFYGSSRPHAMRCRTYQEMFNETFVALSLYHMFIFANKGLTTATQQTTGYSYLSIVFMCLGINVCQALFFAIKRVYLRFKNKSLGTKMKAEIEFGDPNAAMVETVVNYKRKYECKFGNEDLSSCENDMSDLEEIEAYRNVRGLIGPNMVAVPTINDDGLFVDANASINILG